MDKTMLERENKALRAKLLRRSEIIDTIRKAYIADVVTVKEALINFGWAHQAIASEPADEIRECSDFGHNAPSLTVHDILVGLPRLDLREALMKESQVIHDLGLYAPDDCFLEKWHCDSCGGHLEIVMKGNKKVSMMAKEIEELETKMREILDQNITLNQSVNVLTEKLETQSKLNAEESDLQRKKMRLANAAWEDEFDKLQSNRLIEIEGYAAALATSKNQLKKTKKELDFAMSQLKFSSAQANAKQFSDSKLIEDLKGNHKMEIDTLMQLLNRSEEKVSQLERTCKENILQFEDARNSDFLLKEELKRCNMEVEVTKALLESTNKQNVQVMQDIIDLQLNLERVKHDQEIKVSEILSVSSIEASALRQLVKEITEERDRAIKLSNDLQVQILKQPSETERREADRVNEEKEVEYQNTKLQCLRLSDENEHMKSTISELLLKLRSMCDETKMLKLECWNHRDLERFTIIEEGDPKPIKKHHSNLNENFCKSDSSEQNDIKMSGDMGDTYSRLSSVESFCNEAILNSNQLIRTMLETLREEFRQDFNEVKAALEGRKIVYIKYKALLKDAQQKINQAKEHSVQLDREIYIKGEMISTLRENLLNAERNTSETKSNIAKMEERVKEAECRAMRLEQIEQQNFDLISKIKDLKVLLQRNKEIYDKDIASLEDKISTLELKIANLNAELCDRMQQEASLAGEIENLKMKMNVLTKENEELHQLCEVLQTGPEVHSVAIQTEFFIPDMTLTRQAKSNTILPAYLDAFDCTSPILNLSSSEKSFMRAPMSTLKHDKSSIWGVTRRPKTAFAGKPAVLTQRDFCGYSSNSRFQNIDFQQKSLYVPGTFEKRNKPSKINANEADVKSLVRSDALEHIEKKKLPRV